MKKTLMVKRLLIFLVVLFCAAPVWADSVKSVCRLSNDVASGLSSAQYQTIADRFDFVLTAELMNHISKPTAMSNHRAFTSAINARNASLPIYAFMRAMTTHDLEDTWDHAECQATEALFAHAATLYGRVSGVSGDILTDSSQSWANDAYNGMTLQMTSGTAVTDTWTIEDTISPDELDCDSTLTDVAVLDYYKIKDGSGDTNSCRVWTNGAGWTFEHVMDVTNSAWTAKIVSWYVDDLDDANTDGVFLDIGSHLLNLNDKYICDLTPGNDESTGHGGDGCTAADSEFCTSTTPTSTWTSNYDYKIAKNTHMESIRTSILAEGDHFADDKVFYNGIDESYDAVVGGGYYADDLDGGFLEAFCFSPTQTTFNKTIIEGQLDDLIKMLDQGYIIFTGPKNVTLTDYQRRVGYAAFLLANHSTLAYYYVHQKSNGSLYGRLDWFPEYDLDIGTPVGSPANLAALAVGGKTSMYTREYTSGRVVMNNHTSSQIYTTTSDYYKLVPVGGGLVGVDGSISGCFETEFLSTGDQTIPAQDVLILSTNKPVNSCGYYMRNDGTAANKGAAIGPCATASACMNEAVHNGETFDAGSTIVICPDGGVFDSQVTTPSSGSSGTEIRYISQYSATYGWPIFDEGFELATDYIMLSGAEIRPGIAESGTKTFEGMRISDTGTGTTRNWQAAEETPVTGWDKADKFIVGAGIGMTGGGDDLTPEIRWRDKTDSGSWTVLAASGELKYGDCTALTDEANLATGNFGTSSGKTKVEGVKCEQENSAVAGAATTLTAEQYIELQACFDPAGGEDGHEYAFAEFEGGVQIGSESAATLTLWQLDWSPIELFYRAESGTMSSPGDCYESTDNTWDGTTHTADAKYSGTNGLDDDYGLLEPIGNDPYDTVSFAVGWWLNVQTGGNLTNIFYGQQDANNRFTIGIAADNDITTSYKVATSIDCSLTTTDTPEWDSTGWHFLQVSVDMSQGAGSDYIKVYVDGDLEDSVEDCTSTGFTTTDMEIYWGDISATANDMWFDVLIYSNDPTINLYTEGYALETSCTNP